MKQKLLTLFALLLGVCSGAWGQTWWRATSTTVVTADTKYVDDDVLEVKTVYAGKISGYARTYETDGEIFASSIQIRVNAAPSTETPTGTSKEDCTPLVITAKKNATIKFYYRRQTNKGGYASNDGKDMKMVDQSAPTTLIAAKSFVLDATGDYGYAIKEYDLQQGKTYTLWASGTTISLNGFNYKEDTKKTTTTVNSAKSNLHAYLDNAGSINGAANCLSFTNYQMTVDGTSIVEGNDQYQFVVNSTNYTGVKFGKQTYVITPLAGVTITNVKAYGSSNSSSTITISSGESDLELAARGDKNSPVTMSPLTLSTNDGGLYYFTLSGSASQAILVFDVTYDQVENVDVTISDAGYATLYYDKKLAIPAGVTAYAATVKDAETITLTEIENVIPANTGVILKADAGKYNFAVTNADAPAVDNNILVGTTTATTKAALGGTVYTLGQDGEGVVGLRSFTGTDIRAYSAYATSIAASARGFFTFETKTTGVKAIEKTQSANNAYYNLAGQRVAQPQKGLYIMNGKKVIIK